MNDRDNQNICIKDLVFVILKRILIIFLVGVIFGSAIGGYKIVKREITNDILDGSNRINSNETDIQYQERLQNINIAKSYIDMISRVNIQIDHQRQYIANSIYMQIDSENVYHSSVQISIVSDNDINGIDSVLFSAYEREIKAGSYLDEYANKLSVRPEYVKELISCSSSLADKNFINLDNDINNIGSMYFSVIGPSSEFCDEVMDLIISRFESIYPDLNSSVTSHSYSIFEVQQVVKIDESLRIGQNNQIAKIDNLQKQINSYNDSLDKVAKELNLSGRDDIIDYFDSHSESINTDSSSVSRENYSILSILKPGIKYGIIGFVLGAFIVVVIIVYKYIFGKRFTNQAQFYGEFSNIRKIGVLKPTIKRSKYSKKIDLITDDDTQLSVEQNNKLIKFYYNNLTSKYNHVLITGVCDPKVLSSSVKTLGLKGDCKPDMFNNPDVLENLKNYDAVVLLEQRNGSLIKSIQNEITILSNCSIDIVGAIII